ncbi:ABC transporter substrate-binding protein [Paenibacillus sp. FSL H8-0034]|uniref:ABC transporter substrate-binding protein n=1 Tax=Paenibacillus sp. FSL H8-0034 TaxID=2954671 RepID=UPI0030F5BBA3
MKKRVTSFFILGLVLFIVLAGCSSGSQPAAGKTDSKAPVTLRMSLITGSPEELAVWQEVVDAFNKKDPLLQVKLEQVPGGWDGYTKKMTAELAAGTPPDIGRMGVAYMPMFSSKNQLVDLYPYAKSTLNLGDYYESAFSQYIKDDKMFGVPVGIYTLGMYYNKDLFDKAGVAYPPADWNKAWTWEEFRAAAQKITTGTGGNKTFGTYVNLAPERSMQYLWSNGGGIIDDKRTKQIVNTQETKEAYTFLQGLIKDGLSPTPADTKTLPPNDLFMTGRLGMVVEGPWMMPAFGKITNFKWGVAPVARPNASKKAITPNYVDSYVVFKGSKHEADAWKAIQFFIGDESENIMVNRNAFGIPIKKSVAESRKKDMFSTLSEQEKQVWFQSVEFSKEVPFTTNWSEIVNASMKKMDLVGLNQLDAGKAADELAPEIEKLLKEQ